MFTLQLSRADQSGECGTRREVELEQPLNFFLAACSSVALAISSSSSQLAKHFPDTPSTSGEQAR
ncbi:hypothetical protein INR49_028650 [Caranx melampygus]|nr:hypothetical protein INR49_028650 [Caranx melampygus]